MPTPADAPPPQAQSPDPPAGGRRSPGRPSADSPTGPTPGDPAPPRRRRHTIGVPRLKRPLLFRVVLVLVLLVLAGMAAGSWWVRHRGPGRVDAAVRGWMAARVLALSDSVYRLDIGRITYDPNTTSVAVDSFRILTDSARNAARDNPLPGVTVVVRGGHVNGVRLRNFLFGGRRTVAIGAIRFDDIDADVVLPQRAEGSGPAAADTTPAAVERDFFEWERGVSLPEGVPRIRIAQVQVPQVTVIVRPPSGTPGQVRVLPQLALELDSLVMDARDTATTPVYASDIRLSADHYAGGWDSLTTLSIDHAEGSFADSVLRVEGIEIRPTHTDAELRRMPGVPGPRVIAGLGGFDARGIAWGEIFRHATIAVRSVEIDRPRLDLFQDHTRPEPPHRTSDPPVRLPNQVMRDAALRLLVDSVRVRDGRIVYAELERGKPKPGVVTFDDLDGSLVNLSNDPGRMSAEQPLVVTASAKLMGAGLLAAVLEIPLLSKGFDMRYHGTLGPMAFTDFNRFAATNTDIRFDKGEVVGVEFFAVVTDGRARGRVIPRYRDLGIGFTAKSGGFLAKAKRSITRFIANRFVIRRDNPEDAGEGPLVSAPIDVKRQKTDGLFSFLWYSLRDPIRRVIKP